MAIETINPISQVKIGSTLTERFNSFFLKKIATQSNKVV